MRYRSIAIVVAMQAGCVISAQPELEKDEEVPAFPIASALVVEWSALTCKKDLDDEDNDEDRGECTSERPSTYGTTIVGVVRAGQTGALLALELQLCKIELSGVPGGPHFNEDFLESTPTIAFGASLTPNPDGTFWLWSEPAIAQLGVLLDDPLHDDVPDEASDPRVYDQDADGRPGVSLNATLWRRVAVAFRASLALDGDDRGAGEIFGVAHAQADAAIYEDNVPAIDLRRAARERSLATRIIQQESTFRLVPLNPDSVCSTARRVFR